MHPLTLVIWGLIWKKHNGQKTYKCIQCDFASSYASSLGAHSKTHSGEKSYSCNQCDYASFFASNLRIHLKIHSGEKSNKCNQCNYASSQAGNLRTHLKIHNNEMRGLWFHILVCKLLYNYMNLQPTLLFSLHWEDFCLTFFVLLGCLLHLGWSLLPATSYSPVTTPAISTFIALLTGNFLDAIASPSTYPSRWVGGSVSNDFRFWR